MSSSLAYILPQPGIGPGPAAAPGPAGVPVTAVSNQGPLFMPGPHAPELPAPNSTKPEAKSSPPSPPPSDQQFFLRNNDGKGGMPLKYQS